MISDLFNVESENVNPGVITPCVSLKLKGERKLDVIEELERSFDIYLRPDSFSDAIIDCSLFMENEAALKFKEIVGIDKEVVLPQIGYMVVWC